MNLLQAIDPTIPARTAIVGAGGKTTALFLLARQIDGLVWVTTTTHLGTDQLMQSDKHFIIEPLEKLNPTQFMGQRVTLITGSVTADNRVRSLSPQQLDELSKLAGHKKITLLVEADGSRSTPLKAPAEHEPSIPDWVDQVIVVVGLSALGKPFTSNWIYRMDRYAEVTGLSEGDPITIESVKGMLIHPQGGLKNIPLPAKKIALLNQADTVEIQTLAKSVVTDILQGGYDKVIIGSLGMDTQNLESFSK